jgi:hypothetical protein
MRRLIAKLSRLFIPSSKVLRYLKALPLLYLQSPRKVRKYHSLSLGM